MPLLPGRDDMCRDYLLLWGDAAIERYFVSTGRLSRPHVFWDLAAFCTKACQSAERQGHKGSCIVARAEKRRKAEEEAQETAAKAAAAAARPAPPQQLPQRGTALRAALLCQGGLLAST